MVYSLQNIRPQAFYCMLPFLLVLLSFPGPARYLSPLPTFFPHDIPMGTSLNFSVKMLNGFVCLTPSGDPKTDEEERIAKDVMLTDHTVCVCVCVCM